jgi:hypothetical protein
LAKLSFVTQKNTDAKSDKLNSSMTNDTVQNLNDALGMKVIIIDCSLAPGLRQRSFRNSPPQSYLENKTYCGLVNGTEEYYNHSVTIETSMK